MTVPIAVLRAIHVVEDVLSRLALAIVAICVFAQVVSRYVFSSAITWTEELSTTALVWAVYFGAAIGIRKRFHIRILVLVRLLPRPLALGAVMLGDLLFLLFCGMMLWFGYQYLSLLWRREFVSPSLGIDQFYPHSIIAIAYVLIVLHTIVNYWIWVRDGCNGLPGIDEVEGATANLAGESPPA
ncbi:MAG: TRAP transporter small permease [Salinarimonas sp.]